MSLSTIEIPSFARIVECPKSKDKALHANTPIKLGQVLSKFGAKHVYPNPNYLTVQVGDNEHIMLDPEFLQYINHSCEPNVHFNPSEGTVTALRNIEAGEEFTFFYPSTEWSMDRGFACRCESSQCLEQIQGAAHLSPTILSKYTLSPYIQKRLDTLRNT